MSVWLTGVVSCLTALPLNTVVMWLLMRRLLYADLNWLVSGLLLQPWNCLTLEKNNSK